MDKKRISTRFVSPAQDFDLEVLVRRLRKGFAFSVGIAAAQWPEEEAAPRAAPHLAAGGSGGASREAPPRP